MIFYTNLLDVHLHVFSIASVCSVHRLATCIQVPAYITTRNKKKTKKANFLEVDHIKENERPSTLNATLPSRLQVPYFLLVILVIIVLF